MAAEGAALPLGFGDQPGADPAAAQILMHPKQVHEQPAGIAVSDQAGADRAWALGSVVPDEDAEIGVARVAQKRRVVGTEPVIDNFAVGPARLVFEAQPKSSL